MADADDLAATTRRELTERIEAARQGGQSSEALLARAREAGAAGWTESALLLCTQGLDAEPGHEGLVALRRELQAAGPPEAQLTGWPLSPVGAMVLVGTIVCLMYVLTPDLETFKTVGSTLLPVGLVAYVLGKRAAAQAELATWVEASRRLVTLPYFAAVAAVLVASLIEGLTDWQTSRPILRWIGFLTGTSLASTQLFVLWRLGVILRSPLADDHARAAATCFLIAALPALLLSAGVAVEIWARHL